MLAIFDNWPLPRKLMAAFTLLLLLLGGLALNSYVSTASLNATSQRHITRGLATTSTLADIRSDAKESWIVVSRFFNEVDDADYQDLVERLGKARADIVNNVDQLGGVAGDDFAGDVQELRQHIEVMNATNGRILTLREAGDEAGLEALRLGEGRAHYHAALAKANTLLAKARERSANAADEGQASAQQAIALCILLAAIALVGVTMVWVAISRSVARPMNNIADVTVHLAEGGDADVPYQHRNDEIGRIATAVEQFRISAMQRAQIDARSAAEQQAVTTALRESLAAMTDGDLTRRIDVDFPPAYAELKNNYNAALDALGELIGSVTRSAAAIKVGSSEIAHASDDLARRTEGNAASLEETSAAVTQMDQRLRATASAASSTVERADGAIKVVGDGRSIAGRAVEAMGRVSNSAKGIDSVIEGLDKIAFQTRVLAMNAAVEAGRAGDAGRGFAVVADLVSALAMRSEEEAKRAREQLTATQIDIGTAVEAVQRVDGALENIADNVNEVHALLGNIATDNQAQSSTITQISSAVASLDEATQQNAAMVEETSAAARNLTEEVAVLANQAAQFTVDGTCVAGGAISNQSPKGFVPADPSQPRTPGMPKTPSDWMEF